MLLSSPVYTYIVVSMEMTLASYVRRRREELGLNQRELAKRVGTSPAYISGIENGDPKWPQSHVPALARALNVTQAELALAAGIITEAPAARAEPFKPGDVRRKILALLPELRDDEAEFVRIVVQAAIERRRSIGAEEVVPEARETVEAGAIGMAQRQARFLPVEPDEEDPATVII